MSPERAAFLAGERPDDVHVFLHEAAVSDLGALADHGEQVGDGLVLVLEGERARGVFQSATGIDPMAFASDAMGTEGSVAGDCADGTCPTCGADAPRLIFAFAEEQQEDVEGIYAEGDVIHAYAACACGERYSDRWLAGDR